MTGQQTSEIKDPNDLFDSYNLKTNYTYQESNNNHTDQDPNLIDSHDN